MTTIHRLGLRNHNIRPSILADGSIRTVYTYLVDVDWLGNTLPCEAFATEAADATIGAGLLRGRKLFIDYGEPQLVEIT